MSMTGWLAAAFITFSFSITSTFSLAQGEADRQYVDNVRRFTFNYPAEFGEPSRGSNDGFGDRVAAVRFSNFSTFTSSGALGGEAALTRGRPVIDMQAAGGLHDAITLEIFPEPLLSLVLESTPPLTLATFCQEIARPLHLDPQQSAFAKLTPAQRAAIENADRMRNVDPKVILCETDGDTITFHKEVSFQPGFPRQHVYGVVRFLAAPYSTFQLVRVGPAPSAALLAQMTAVVSSWRSL